MAAFTLKFRYQKNQSSVPDQKHMFLLCQQRICQLAAL